MVELGGDVEAQEGQGANGIMWEWVHDNADDLGYVKYGWFNACAST